VLSEEMAFDCSVPQGNCLGPLLFIIFQTDIAEALLDGDMTCYADDTAIFVAGNFRQQVFKKAQHIINNVNKNWLDYKHKLYI